nr:quercetin 2,3-dioxygenase [Mammaliicoccus sp. Marseille-Q6498]
MSILNNQLPTEKIPYLIANGEGEHYLWNKQVFTFLATNESTDNLFEVVTITGGKNESFPIHSHNKIYESILVTEGVLEIQLEDQTITLTRGDYILIPPGIAHSYVMKAHRTKLLTYAIGGNIVNMYKSIGHVYNHPKHPSYIEHDETLNTQSLEETFDIVFSSHNTTNEEVVYHASGEGENLLTGDQLHSLITNQTDTDGNYIVVSTEGPTGEAIVSHYHEKHTETFYCFEGKVTMWVGNNLEEITLYPGDFLHAPAETIHSYRFDAHYTKMVGLLVPGLFEPFFRTLGETYEHHTFPNEPHELDFGKVIKKIETLDLKFPEK